MCICAAWIFVVVVAIPLSISQIDINAIYTSVINDSNRKRFCNTSLYADHFVAWVDLSLTCPD